MKQKLLQYLEAYLVLSGILLPITTAIAFYSLLK